MEKRSVNSITEYSVYRIKKCFLDSFLSFLGILLVLFINMECIYHVEWIKIGKIETEYGKFFTAFFYTLLVFGITVNIGLVALIVYFLYIMVKEYKKINYYKEPRFSYLEEREIEYDYKLWQTAPKHSFHSQAIKMTIDGEERLFKTPIIFTNSKKIGFFKIPLILQSHSYVRGKALLGYDPDKNEAVIIEINEKI